MSAVVDRDSARAFRRDLRRVPAYRALVHSYRGVLVCLAVGVPVLTHATGTARNWASVAFVLAFLASWGGALVSMFALLRAEARLRGASPYIPAFLLGLATDVVALGWARRR